MLNILKLTGIVITGLFASLLFKESNRTVSAVTVICTFLTAVLFSVRGGISEAVGALSANMGDELAEKAGVLLKAVGISYITGISCELCSSAGEGTLADAAGFAGKTEIILLCVPMISELLSIAGQTI